MNTFTLTNVTVTYPKALEPALQDVSLTVQKNRLTMIIGPNGSGKSTLLKAILGIVPYTGTIRAPFENTDIPQVGYVPQRFHFDFSVPLTVHELLHLALIPCKHTHEEKQRMITDALQIVHADELTSKPLRELSGGQLQRVLLARALVHNPDLLILDEPEAGIDISGEHTVYDILQNLSQTKKKTILVTSHELQLVHAYADTVVCLNKTILCSGKPTDTLDSSIFQQLYSTPMKMYTHHC